MRFWCSGSRHPNPRWGPIYLPGTDAPQCNDTNYLPGTDQPPQFHFSGFLRTPFYGPRVNFWSRPLENSFFCAPDLAILFIQSFFASRFTYLAQSNQILFGLLLLLKFHAITYLAQTQPPPSPPPPPPPPPPLQCSRTNGFLQVQFEQFHFSGFSLT